MFDELIRQNFIPICLKYYQLMFSETLPAAGRLVI
jgi:hypothetical protein